MNILIAEDAPSDRMLLKYHLEKLGHYVAEVNDGEELVSYFQHHASEFDLLVVDLNMPNKSGEHAIREIRDYHGTYDASWIPIIVLSGSELDDDILRCIQAGADDYLTKPIQHKVLTAKLLSMTRLADMRKRLVQANTKLKALSTTDYLTDLPNRRSFEKDLYDEMSKALRYGQKLSVAVIDIDHFKQINDTYGHEGGDVVLQSLSKCLMEAKRAGDIFGRIGGEEFGLILPHTDASEAKIACERYRQLILNTAFQYEDRDLYLTISIGVCEFSDEVSQLELIKRADLGLYAAKHNGRNQVVLAS